MPPCKNSRYIEPIGSGGCSVGFNAVNAANFLPSACVLSKKSFAFNEFNIVPLGAITYDMTGNL